MSLASPGSSNTRSTTHRSQIDGPVRSSGSYTPRVRSCGINARSRARMGRHCESRSVQRTATGLLGVVRVVGGRGFKRRLQAFDDGGRGFGHLGAQTLVLTNIAFRMPLHPDSGGTASLGPRRYCAHIPALISHVSVSFQGRLWEIAGTSALSLHAEESALDKSSQFAGSGITADVENPPVVGVGEAWVPKEVLAQVR